MFDLEKAVDEWCRSVHPISFKRKALIRELKDHLYCEIERLQAHGATDKQAFVLATQKMGKLSDLAEEYAKNRNLISRVFSDLFDSVLNNEELMTPKRAATLNILVSIVFALAMLASSYFLRDTTLSETVLFILIALWWIPFSMLTARGAGPEWSVKSEYNCMKRKLSQILNRG